MNVIALCKAGSLGKVGMVKLLGSSKNHQPMLHTQPRGAYDMGVQAVKQRVSKT